MRWYLQGCVLSFICNIAQGLVGGVMGYNVFVGFNERSEMVQNIIKTALQIEHFFQI